MGRYEGSRPGRWKSSSQLQGSRELMPRNKGRIGAPQPTTFPRAQPCCTATRSAKLASKMMLPQVLPVLRTNTYSTGTLMLQGGESDFYKPVIFTSLKHSPDPSFVSCSQKSLTPSLPTPTLGLGKASVSQVWPFRTQGQTGSGPPPRDGKVPVKWGNLILRALPRFQVHQYLEHGIHQRVIQCGGK